ncbi:hypothetical protein RA210_U10777 [Rubrivivax sp. A210]|nr:hypothetical protein RA210_U10777 [Rubrivivax sp. A210]
MAALNQALQMAARELGRQFHETQIQTLAMLGGTYGRTAQLGGRIGVELSGLGCRGRWRHLGARGGLPIIRGSPTHRHLSR